LLLALLTGNRKLEYSQKVPMEFPSSTPRPKGLKKRELNIEQATAF
jgi:hypothetical protein